MKRLVIFCFICSFLFSFYPKVNVFFKGERVLLENPYKIHNNRLAIPAEEFSKKTGFVFNETVNNFNIVDGNHRKVTFLKNHDQVNVGESVYYLPDNTFLYNKDWYLPLGYFAWYLGYTMNRTGNNYYVSKRLTDFLATEKEIRIIFSSKIDENEFKLKKESNGYSLDFQHTVLSFPRKVLSNSFSSEIILGQITTMPDLSKLFIKTDKELSLTKEGYSQLIIKEKSETDENNDENIVIPKDIESLDTDKVSERAVWIPSFENVSNIMISVKGNKQRLSGKAVYREGKYLVPAEMILIPFGFSYNVSFEGTVLVKYGDEQDIDTKVKSYQVNKETYLPLQEIAKKLGLGLRWDYRIHTLFINPIINDVIFKKTKEGDSVLISSYVEIEPRNIFELPNPNRLIIDIPHSVIDVKQQIVNVKDSNINQIKVAQFDEETVRVVVEIKRAKNYALAISDDGTNISIQPAGEIKSVWYEAYDKHNVLTLHGDDLQNIEWKFDNNILEILVPNVDYNARDVYYFNDFYLEKIVGSLHTWDPLSSRVSIYFKQDVEISIQENQQRIDIKFDNSKGKSFYTTEETIQSSEKPINAKALSGKTIVIESGHGGLDVGAIGIGGTYEKWFNLDTSHRIKKELTKYGATVLMPIIEDKYMSLAARTQFANRNKADLYISVHFNSFISERAKGISTYYYSHRSKVLAENIQKELVSFLGLRDNRTIFARLFVLFHTSMPAVLIEPGFLSNRSEYEMFLKEENRDKIAQAVVKGVINYYGK
jgi:N-acetylmuramoyl-L-alanine amidase